ncbi:Hypothetical lipoprotein [Tenacibaculum litopenaei]|uniref:hypothetical protein n=1 Tax=Tenacibaculum litopenaei TaxID=396016 RepID=UPI0038962EB3
MKKLLIGLVVVVSVLCVGCTDTSLEDLEKNNDTRELQLIDHTEVGDDDDEQQEGNN